MGERTRAIGVLQALLLCGCISSVYSEGHGHSSDVVSFHIPPPKSAGKFQLHHKDPSVHDTNAHQQGKQKGGSDQLPFLQLCYPQGRQFAGFEGLIPQGLVLEKVYALVVSPSTSKDHLPLPGLPSSLSKCSSFQQVSKSSTSEKVKSYPQLVHDYKQLRRSKSGLGVFEMLPSETGCSPEDASPRTLSRMIQLGEFLGRRYRTAWPWLQDVGRDPVIASSVPESPSFQSVAAMLHGLLHEKQFCRMEMKKLQRHIVRGLGSHQPCPAIAEVELFMEKAYKQEKDIFKSKDATYNVPVSLYRSLGVGRGSPTKDVAKSLHHLVCELDRDPCVGGQCLNLTPDSLRQLREVAAQHNAYLSSNPVFQSYAMADTSLHLDRVLSWFSQPVHTDHVIKVDMVDEFFFLKLLSAWGHRLNKHIGSTSRLVVEQFHKTQSNGTGRFWRVLVDGEVVTDSLWSCSGGASKGLCGVETFKAYLKDWAQNNMFGACMGPKVEL